MIRKVLPLLGLLAACSGSSGRQLGDTCGGRDECTALTNPGLLSSFAAVFDADGVNQRSTIIGQVSRGARITTDAEGNVMVFGAFRGEVDLGGDPLVAAGGRDGFVLGLTSELSHSWSRRYGGERDDLVSEVVVGSKGDLYFAGSFGDVIELDGTKLTSTGSLDVFLSRLAVP